MNYSIKLMVVITLFSCISNIVVSSEAASDIVPTTKGPNAIVDAIKEYSDITDADVNKYKLL